MADNDTAGTSAPVRRRSFVARGAQAPEPVAAQPVPVAPPPLPAAPEPDFEDIPLLTEIVDTASEEAPEALAELSPPVEALRTEPESVPAIEPPALLEGFLAPAPEPVPEPVFESLPEPAPEPLPEPVAEPEPAPELLLPVEPPPPPEPPVIPQDMIDARAAELVQAHMPFQRQAIADELANWLDTELPQVVLHVIDGVTDQLIAKVTEEARAALLPRLQEALEPDNISLDDES